MALKLDDPDSKIDRGYSDGNGAYSSANLSDAENAPFDDSANNDDNQTNKSIADQEKTPSKAISDPWKNNVNGDKKKQKINFMSRLSGNKKWLAGGGIGAGLITIPLIFMSLLPLKLEMFIKNITDLASTVPAYATEQRLDYLITRALATRLLMKANGISPDEGKIIFCKNGAIGCSLFTTYTNDYFDKKLGITLDATSDGRTELGGRAKNWQVSLGNGAGGESIEGPMRQITSNSEMKALIRSEIHSKTRKNQIITRFLAKKILMKKYGVTTWRGPAKVEKAVNSLSEAKSNVNSNIIKNTVGKISPRVATYLTCLQGEATTCKQLREKLSADIPNVQDPADNPDLQGKEGTPEYEAAQKEFEKYKVNKALISGIADTSTDAAAKSTSKFISKKVMAVAGGAAAIVGVLDMVFVIVNSIGDGALEEVGADMAAQVNVGFAAEIQTTNDKMKASDLDVDTVAATTELLDGAENAPLQQAENGLAVDTSSGITTKCKGTKDGEKVNTQLGPNQLVCPEQQSVRNYSSWTENIPAWGPIKQAAKIWVDSVVGMSIAAMGEISSAIMGPIIGKVMEPLGALFGDKIESVLGSLANTIFDPPVVGSEESGADNYVALSAGIRTTQNAIMEEGVDTDGTAMGAGGKVLTSAELVVVTEESKKIENQYFENQPLMARIFNLDLTGSFIQQFASRIPTSVSSVARLPVTSFGQFLSGTLTSAATTRSTINPFNLPLYGYAAGDPALTADPGVYTEDYCSTLAADRLASKNIERDVSVSLVSVYTVADPCALEKMVVGSALNSEGVTDDKYSLKKPSFGSTAPPVESAPSGGVGTPENVTTKGSGWILTDGLDYSAIPCATGTVDDGMYTHPTRSFTIRKCKVAGGSVASIVSTNAAALFTAANAAGVNLSLTSGYRSYELQAKLRRDNCNGNSCRPPTAKPGNSQHESGIALDIAYNGSTICFPSPTASCIGNNGLEWLKVNASKYGFINLPSEAWHWSPSGS